MSRIGDSAFPLATFSMSLATAGSSAASNGSRAARSMSLACWCTVGASDSSAVAFLDELWACDQTQVRLGCGVVVLSGVRQPRHRRLFQFFRHGRSPFRCLAPHGVNGTDHERMTVRCSDVVLRHIGLVRDVVIRAIDGRASRSRGS